MYLRIRNNSSSNSIVSKSRSGSASPRRRGITLVELIIASVVAAILAGLTMVALQQAVRARNQSKRREEATQRVFSVAQLIAKDLANQVRDQELASSKIWIRDGDLVGTDSQRDELLVFAQSHRQVRLRSFDDLTEGAEGGTYEVQYRLVPMDGDVGTVWRRRDPVPDEYYDGGGVAVPISSGITSLEFEAFDGTGWLTEWDSDTDGLPFAVRVTCRAPIGDSAALAFAQCVIGVDRVPKPVWMAQDDPNFNLFGDQGDSGDLFGGGDDSGDGGNSGFGTDGGAGGLGGGGGGR